MGEHLSKLPPGFPNFKGKPKKTKLTKRLRAAKKRELDEEVQHNMRMVRLEDQYCRFIGCGCRKFFDLEVAHLMHRGAGGNPSADRSDPGLMILLCKVRHRTGRFALDNGTIEIRPLTADGTRGAVSFWIDKRRFTMSLAQMGTGEPEWVEVAREAWPHVIGWTNQELLSQIREAA